MTPSDRRRVLATAGTVVFMNFAAVLGLVPLFPSVARDLGLGPDSLGVYLLLGSLANSLLQLPGGVLADRFGRRRVLIAGLVLMCAGQLLRWQAPTAAIFGAGQVVLGVCSVLSVSPSYAVVADAYTTGRAQAMGVIQIAVNTGQVAGYLVAGAVAPFLGWRGYALGTALLPLLLIPLVATMPEVRHPPSGRSLGGEVVAALRFLLWPPSAAIAVAAATALGSGFGASYLLPFLAHAHGISAGWTSVLLVPYVVGSVVGAPLAGRWADRAGLRLPLTVSFSAAAVAILAFGLAGFSPLAVVLCFGVIGAGTSSSVAMCATTIVELAGRTGTGSGAALGGLRVGQALGPALAPAGVGFLLVREGSLAAYAALALTCLVGIALARIATAPREQPPVPAPEPT
ncbi:MAG TPA: MFS transporter [Candidatus Dormibacteraeota bacterium]